MIAVELLTLLAPNKFHRVSGLTSRLTSDRIVKASDSLVPRRCTLTSQLAGFATFESSSLYGGSVETF